MDGRGENVGNWKTVAEVMMCAENQCDGIGSVGNSWNQEAILIDR